MKPILIAFLIFYSCIAFSQNSEFHVQGQVVDSNNNPIPDAYVVNYRDLNRSITRSNGVFDVWILPEDSISIMHVTFLRKIVTAFELMKNPVIQLENDTISIPQVDIYPNKKTDLERANENIQQIKFDPRPQIHDGYTGSERMQQLLNSQNKVERAAANSLTYRFSPSVVIGKIIDKIKVRKKSNEYYSTKKKTRKQDSD